MGQRGRPRIPLSVVRPGLQAVARGRSQAEAAAMVGVSLSTMERWVAKEGVAVLRDRKAREGALTIDDREEIRVGIERGESDRDIGVRIAKHRATVWRQGSGAVPATA